MRGQMTDPLISFFIVSDSKFLQCFLYLEIGILNLINAEKGLENKQLELVI